MSTIYTQWQAVAAGAYMADTANAVPLLTQSQPTMCYAMPLFWPISEYL